MKKYLAIILAGVMVFGLVACNNEPEAQVTTEEANNTAETTEVADTNGEKTS